MNSWHERRGHQKSREASLHPELQPAGCDKKRQHEALEQLAQEQVFSSGQIVSSRDRIAQNWRKRDGASDMDNKDDGKSSVQVGSGKGNNIRIDMCGKKRRRPGACAVRELRHVTQTKTSDRNLVETVAERQSNIQNETRL